MIQEAMLPGTPPPSPSMEASPGGSVETEPAVFGASFPVQATDASAGFVPYLRSTSTVMENRQETTEDRILEKGEEHREEGSEGIRRSYSDRDPGVWHSSGEHQTTGQGTRIFQHKAPSVQIPDADSGPPEEYGSQATDEQQSGSTLVTGFAESAYVSMECNLEVEAYISGILRPDCNPVAISVLVCNENLTKYRRNYVESDCSRIPETKRYCVSLQHKAPPPFDAEKSCAQLKEALESYGVMVISVVNRSREYLAAILTVLASRMIPRSCEFLWFIFNGHGAGSHFSVNGELVAFNQLIRKASKIAIRRMAFFFDCCQLNTDGIKVVNIQKEHMTLYSAPPDEVAYHQYGVGLMVTCLAKLLLLFRGSLNDLQSKLRDRLMSKMVDALGIPSNDLDDWKQKHLPHHTSSMFDINLYKIICEAMQPVISVNKSDENDEVHVIVYSPQRIMHHPSGLKFELRFYKFIIEKDDDHTIDFGMADAEFNEDPTSHVFTLPPQACKTSGGLKVGAVYGDGTVEFCGPIKVELPCYGKLSIISCTSEENGFKVRVVYNANIRADKDSEAYRVEYIEIGYHDPSCLGQWRMLHREEGGSPVLEHCITLPPSPEQVERDLQVAVKYICCPDVIFSDPWTVEQPALSKPTIASVEHVDALTGILKFAPNQYAGYQVCQYSVHTRPNNSSHWVKVHTKALSHEECLSHGEVVPIPLHLVEEKSVCEYQVAMHYLDVAQPVRSEIHQERLEPTGVPRIDVAKNSLLSSNTTIGFTHPDSYPGSDSPFRQELEYEIVSKNGVETCPSTSSSVEVQRNLVNSFKVKVSYKDGRFKDLGQIYCDTCKQRSNVCHSICSPCWNVVPNTLKGFIALVLIAVLVASLSLYGGIYFPRPLNNQLIAVNETIPFQLQHFKTWCGGALAKEYVGGPADFPPGFDISAYLVDGLALKTEHYEIPSTRYPYINETIDFSNNEDHYLLPINYYQSPPYLLEGSVVSLQCKINMPDSIDKLSYAVIHFFDSVDDAVKYQHSGKFSKSPVHSIAITDCATATCTVNYTITKNSFYFPVLSTKANSEYQITVNFTFDVYSYVDPSTLPSAVNVANFSKNSSGEIPLHHSKVILLYAHPPNATAYERLAHLHFSCVPHYAVQVPVYLALFLLEAVMVGVYCCWCINKHKKRRRQSTDTEIPPTMCETTPLLINS